MSDADSACGQRPVTIVAFGDSITQASHQPEGGRWTDLLCESLARQLPDRAVRMINAGVGGNTSREGLQRFERDVLAHAPDVVLAEFGNDATPDTNRHVSPDEFASNFEIFRREIEERGGGRLIILVFPPVVDAWHQHGAHPFYAEHGGADGAQEVYRERVRAFARSHGVPLVDLSLALRRVMGAEGPGSCILPDGVHLTARGNRMVADAVLVALAPEIARAAPASGRRGLRREAMTSRARWLAALRMQPVDRLPFWPKVFGGYLRGRPSPFGGMDADRFHEWVGSDRHLGLPCCLSETRRRTSVEEIRSGDTRRTVYRTAQGETALVCQYDAPSDSWHPMEFPVRSPSDIGLMTAVFEDVAVELDAAALERARQRAAVIGEGALTSNSIGESPLMYWVEWLAGVENAHLLLADCRDEVEALFEAMHRVLKRRAELLCAHSPADSLYLIENTSTTLISPEQYARYCARYVGEYAAIAAAADRNLILHMCGHLKALLPQLAQIPARAFEAFTSPTLGNATLLDGRTACPNTCLIGGTNAMLWTRPAAEIVRQIQADLDCLPHHRGIVVTSAGVMPPACAPETIKQVCEWVQGYPAR